MFRGPSDVFLWAQITQKSCDFSDTEACKGHSTFPLLTHSCASFILSPVKASGQLTRWLKVALFKETHKEVVFSGPERGHKVTAPGSR